jgi:flagellar motor switch protein FliM
MLNIAFPSVVSSALLRKLGTELVYQRAQGAAVNQESLRKRMLQSGVELELATPPIPVRLTDLLSLQPGKVLPLRRRIDEPACLRVRGRDTWLARPVSSSNNSRAAQLLQYLEQPEKEDER